VVNALSKAKLGPGTATGEAIFTALDSIGTIDPDTQTAGGPPPAMIIVMSDGTTTVGRPDDVAVAAAKDAGVPVSTIAYGTPDGTITIEGQRVAVPADGAALQAIAQGTGGQFFSAESGDQLRQVYDQIGQTVGFDVETAR
jgi:Ca-activated chloride channel family protein